MAPDPVVGVVFDRTLLPGAKILADLTDPQQAGRFLCDEHLPLSEALARDWAEDAHLSLYRVVDDSGEAVYARVTKKSPFVTQLAAAGGSLQITFIALDYDLPGHREWRDQNEPLGWLATVPDFAPSPTVWHTTLHGSRLIYVLTTPVSGPAAEGLIEALVRRWASLGVALDHKCGDWTRLYRLPRATREDSGKNFAHDPRFYLVDGGPELDPTSIDHTPAPQGEYANVREYVGDQPDEPTCNARAQEKAFRKAAKRMLQGREAFAVAFEEKLFDPALLAGGWNNTVLHYVGQVTAMLAGHESASPEGCFALLRPALEQLRATDEDQKDWITIGWDMTRRMWAQEEAKLTAERVAEEQSAAEGEAHRRELLAALRAEAPEGMPEDPEEAASWVERRLIASHGRHHYVMRRDLSYNLFAVGESGLIPMIRDLGMDGAIPVTTYRGQQKVYRTAADVLAANSVRVKNVRCSVLDKAATIDGPSGERVLHMPIHRLNSKLQAAFSPPVDEWLRALFGDMFEDGVDWISHALNATGPICALNLYGASGSGKGMFCLGLAECFEGEFANDGRVLDRFNTGLLRSPLIVCDEGVPHMRSLGSTTDEVFRSLVAGGDISIEGKGQDTLTAHMYPRILFTSNSRDIIRAIVGSKDLTSQDVRAIEKRLLSIHVGPEAHRLLTGKGNTRYTRGWVRGEVPSNYIVANHFAHLYTLRKPSRNSDGRFLVEGGEQSAQILELRLNSDEALAVLRTLVRMLESPTPSRGLYTALGQVWVTISGVTEFLETANLTERRLSMATVGRALRNFAMGNVKTGEEVKSIRPPGAKKTGRWMELDLATILEEAFRYGMSCDRIESIMRTREGGGGLVCEAKLAAGKGTK